MRNPGPDLIRVRCFLSQQKKKDWVLPLFKAVDPILFLIGSCVLRRAAVPPAAGWDHRAADAFSRELFMVSSRTREVYLLSEE